MSETKTMSKEDWLDAADLGEQLQAQCEIAFDDHTPKAREWMHQAMYALINRARKHANKKQPTDPDNGYE